MSKSSGVIVVLGSPNDEQGRLSSMALERCERAIKEYLEHPGYYLLPTGGFGEHFNTTSKPHGSYIQKYLASRGIPEPAILECVKSGNTIQDAVMSRPIIDRYKFTDLIVVTSDFHAERAGFLFKREFPGRSIKISGSITHLPEKELEMYKAHEKRALQKLRG